MEEEEGAWEEGEEQWEEEGEEGYYEEEAGQWEEGEEGKGKGKGGRRRIVVSIASAESPWITQLELRLWERDTGSTTMRRKKEEYQSS